MNILLFSTIINKSLLSQVKFDHFTLERVTTRKFPNQVSCEATIGNNKEEASPKDALHYLSRKTFKKN